MLFVQVNGQKMGGRSQAEAVNVLRSTRGLVKILVQREEMIQSPRTPAIEVSSVNNFCFAWLLWSQHLCYFAV